MTIIQPLCRYAIACYLLQAKDRHNGNILVDSLGHLVHIDFGFILEISPGGNLGFESAAFKLSHEMTQLLDPSGNRTSPQFHLFQEYCIRGYLAVSSTSPQFHLFQEYCIRGYLTVSTTATDYFFYSAYQVVEDSTLEWGINCKANSPAYANIS